MNNQAVKFMFIASLLFAIMNVMVKELKHIPVAQIVFMRSLVMFLIVLSLLKKRNLKPFGKRRKLLVLRGLFGTLGIAFFFYTLHNMPLASAVVVHYLTPIITVLLAFLLGSDKPKPIQWLFFLLCFAGIYMIKGFDSRVDTLVLLIGVAGTVGAAAAYNIISIIRESEHYLVIMFYFPLVTLPLVILYMLFTGDFNWGKPLDWVYLSAIGVLTYGAQYFLTRSYQSGLVNKVSIISYLGVVYALAFGYFLFDEWYNLPSLMGVLLVVCGVVLNLIYGRTRKTTSSVPQRDRDELPT